MKLTQKIRNEAKRIAGVPSWRTKNSTFKVFQEW